ncbi:hypothetical protein [Streptomyces sp. NPDC050988]|uniref:hypothetical protein n=1 Tax=Streptomyces sp. NPDC050988 TaxID=3365637 RepID=UPI003797E6AD
MANDVFSKAVRRRNQFGGMAFNSMAAKCGWQRSSAWWNNMANYLMETPPAPKYIPGIARVLKVSERRVGELIAEQWYAVKPDDAIPDHLKDVVTLLGDIDLDDLPVVEELLTTLGKKRALATKLAQIAAEAGAAKETEQKAA